MKARRLPMLWQQYLCEFRKLWRVPAFSATALALPVLMFLFIGQGSARTVIDPRSNLTFGAFFLASMGAYAVANVMVFSFGISVAVERGQRQNVLLRATPMPGAIYLAAKVLTALAFSLVALLVLFTYVHFAAGVNLPLAVWFTLAMRLLLGSIPFIALGFAIGYVSGPNAAPGVVNLIYLPLAFASGLFFPTNQLPGFIRPMSPYLPLHAYGDLAWDAVGAPITTSLTTDVLLLAGYGVVLLALALAAYRREVRRSFA